MVLIRAWSLFVLSLLPCFFRFCLLAFSVGTLSCTLVGQESVPSLGTRLNDKQSAGLAQLAIAGLQREFPNKPANVITSPATILGPKQMHPAFYGCYDWHSSVHGHWMLVRLLKISPKHPLAEVSRLKLAENLTGPNIEAEAAYFDEKENKSFERMYGWAWLLRLVDELHTWDDPQGKQWCATLIPLERKIVELTKNYLPRLKQPIRTGVHPDTAFALGRFSTMQEQSVTKSLRDSLPREPVITMRTTESTIRTTSLLVKISFRRASTKQTSCVESLPPMLSRSGLANSFLTLAQCEIPN